MIFGKEDIMKYKIKDVKRILNIKEETLRYYDNQNIIKTSRDESNNYRYFKATDINKIFAYKMYRSLLFSSMDAKQLVSGNSEDYLLDKLNEQLTVIKNEQNYLERAHKHIFDLQIKLSKWKSFQGGFEIVESPGCYYHPNQTLDSFILNSTVFENSWHCFDYFPSIWPCFYYEPSIDDKISFGYGIEVEHVELADMIHLSPTKCLYTMFLLNTDLFEHMNTLLEEANQYCRQNGYSLSGITYGNILHETKKDGHISQLFDVYMPIV